MFMAKIEGDDIQDIYEKIAKEDFGKRAFQYFGSIRFDIGEVIHNPHTSEIFPGLRGIIEIKNPDLMFDDDFYNLYSYEIGVQNPPGRVYFNLYRARNHHNPMFSTRFNSHGLVAPAGLHHCEKVIHPFSKEHFHRFCDFNRLVDEAYRNLFS